MSLITFIGDVHGKMARYGHVRHSLPKDRRTIQLGDMGIGFAGVGVPPMAPRHQWIRGNHDNPVLALGHPNNLGDYGYEYDTDLMWIAGAASIDKEWRVPGKTWWSEEEMSYQELNDALTLYLEMKPRFVCAHECPAKANAFLLAGLMGSYFIAKGGLMNSRTAQAMQSMLEGHAPDVWIFGHYHIDKEFYIPGFKTKFRCVAELSQVTLDTETGEFVGDIQTDL